jgi:C4-dicarboxylate transporter DctQ subunit
MEVFNGLAAIVFCAGMCWYGWDVVATARMIDERSATDLRFPMWLYYAALPAGSVLMLARHVIRLAGLVDTSRWRTMLPQHPGAPPTPHVQEPVR